MAERPRHLKGETTHPNDLLRRSCANDLRSTPRAPIITRICSTLFAGVPGARGRAPLVYRMFRNRSGGILLGRKVGELSGGQTMRLFKMFGGKALAVALGLAMVPASIAIPQSAPIAGPVVGVSEAQAQYYRGGHRGYHHGGRHWRGDRGYYRHHRRSNRNAAIGGAVAGLALGAIIAGAAALRGASLRSRSAGRSPCRLSSGALDGRMVPLLLAALPVLRRALGHVPALSRTASALPLSRPGVA